MDSTFDYIKSINLNNVQKRALFKIAVDMVKIDNRIHSKEVSILDNLQSTCGISSEEIELIHYIPLQRAISALKSLSENNRKAVITAIETIVSIDNDIDAKENMLLTAIKMALTHETSTWCNIISTSNVDAESSSKQIIYLEQGHCDEAHSVFGDPYDNLLITKALNDIGLQLFYLPNVVGELNQHWNHMQGNDTKYDLLRRSMEFIVPAGDHVKLANLSSILLNLDTATFYRAVASRYHITPEMINYQAFLMVKIQDGYILDDDAKIKHTIDFLTIDVSRDVKKRVLSFVHMMEVPVCLLSYEGYYRLLYDYLSSESKIMSSIVLDQRYEFRLKDLGNETVKMESSPQARTFYLTVLKYGRAGISQSCFEDALRYLENIHIDENFQIEDFISKLKIEDKPHTNLIYNILTIYEELSTKDSSKTSYLGYATKIIRHRSTLKNYVNNGFAKITRLANQEQYCIAYNSELRCYYIPIGTSFINYIDPTTGQIIPLTQSSIWQKLK